MAIVFIAALVALLEAKEKDFGRELTREDVESIRDNATAIELPAEIARDMIKSRGYPDIDAQNVWDEWLLYKNHKFLRTLMCFEQNFSKSVNYSVKEYYDFW